MKNCMNSYTKISDVDMGVYVKRKKKQAVSDTIYTFDIETTSLFKFDTGWNVFNWNESKETYRNMDKMSVPYIWMFGIENNVYYGRYPFDFLDVFKKISHPHITKVIWVQNLSFEFGGFLPSILKDYTITDMCSRDVRKPISFHIEELNITFRCSYMLTNLSLAKATEEYTTIKKLDTLDYTSKIRTPKTKLTDDELLYCEYDIRCLYEIIKHYRNKYEHIGKIPLTATGEVRNALRQHVDFNYIRKQWDLVPSAKMYMRLMACFQGGYTHANILNCNKVIEHVKSYDISSSYPTVMCLEKFPKSSFMYIDYDDYMEIKNNDDVLFMFHIKLYGVNSIYYNNYISYSRCVAVNTQGMIYDNGRIKSCSYCEMWVTDVDLEIIRKNYNIDRIEYCDIYYAKADYLDIRVIQFILELYGNKTTLKGVDDKIAIYKLSKSYINSLYGMSVTNPLKNSAVYDTDGWSRKELTEDFVKEVLSDARKSYSTLFYYAVGVWVTAYARRNLYMTILKSHDFDKHVIYCDTDSIKYYGDYDYIFESYNEQIYQKYQQVCDRFSQLNIEMFEPIDIKGNIHPLGIFDYEGEYQQFKTLGAKKYCYVDDNGLHITVAGVAKSGASALKSIDDFKKGFEWDYFTSGKLAHFYNDEQEPITIIDNDGNEYVNECTHGIILQPTSYRLGIDELYESLIEIIDNKEYRK